MGRYKRVWGSLPLPTCISHSSTTTKGVAMKQKIALLFAVLLLAGSPVEAQNARNKTFPLHKEFTAQVFICAEVEYAKEVADDETSVTVQVYSALGICGGGVTRVTYVKHIHKSKEGNNVYEVKINGHTAYAITNWNHETI